VFISLSDYVHYGMVITGFARRQMLNCVGFQICYRMSVTSMHFGDVRVWSKVTWQI